MLKYIPEEYPLQECSYKIIGIGMDIHRTPGPGFLEIVYKDAFEYELQSTGISYEREKEFLVVYKKIILPHKFYRH